jgi:hypothetical protein
MNIAIIFGVPEKSGCFLTSSATVSIASVTMLHEEIENHFTVASQTALHTCHLSENFA